MNKLIIEIVSVIFGIASIWLAAKHNRNSWLVGLINVVCTSILVYEANLMYNFGLQIFYFVYSIYAYKSWNEGNSTIEPFNIKRLVIAYFFVLGVSLLLQNENGFTLLDAFTTFGSLVATILLVHKKCETWGLWIVVDMFYVFLYYSQELYWLAILNVLFTILAVMGLLNWIKYERASRVSIR